MRILRLFLVTIASICVISPAFAQVKFGAIAGVNIGNITVDPEDRDLTSRMGFAIGVVAQKQLGDNMDLLIEPMYLEKGAKEDTGGSDVTIKMTYLEIPVLIRFMFGTGDIRPHVVAGPSLGLNLSAKAEGSSGGFNVDSDLKDQLKSVDFGFLIGAGASKPVGDNAVFGEIRYTAGLTNLSDDPDVSDASLKTNGLQVLFGIIFGGADNR